MTASDMASRDPGVGKRRFGLKSMRARMFLLVLVCAVPALLGTAVAIGALTSVHGSVVQLDSKSVQPLATLGDLRDMEGDMRSQVWDYLAKSPHERLAVIKDVAGTDRDANTDIDAYLAEQDSKADRTSVLMGQFAAKLAHWRSIRDHQVFAVALAGHTPLAYVNVRSALADADDAMSVPLDDLYTIDVKDAATRERGADSLFGTARLTLIAIIAAGLLASILFAWWTTRGMLRVVGRIREVLASDGSQQRVNDDDGGEVGALAKALDAMLDDAAAHEASLQSEQEAREEQLRS